MNYRKEIISLNVKGSISPYKGGEGKYHSLYITTCIDTGYIYVGVHSSIYMSDKYVGCGISSPSDARGIVKTGRNSPLAYSVVKCGISRHERVNILYFDNKKDAFELESKFVTQSFIERDEVLNNLIGGSAPPNYSGEKNSNYGNYWSDEQKKIASDRVKGDGRYVGNKNPNIRKCRVIDVITMEVTKYDSIIDVAEAVGVKRQSVSSFLMRENVIVARRFLIFKEEDYLKIESNLKETVEECVNKSRSIKFILKSRKNDC